MFIDWLTLLLVNMMVALVLHALFMGFWLDKDPKKVIPGFAFFTRDNVNDYKGW